MIVSNKFIKISFIVLSILFSTNNLLADKRTNKHTETKKVEVCGELNRFDPEGGWFSDPYMSLWNHRSEKFKYIIVKDVKAISEVQKQMVEALGQITKYKICVKTKKIIIEGADWPTINKVSGIQIIRK